MSRIITRETTFNQLTDKEREILTKGFKIHIESDGRIDLSDLDYSDVYDLLQTADPAIVFYTQNGQEGFALQISKRKFLEEFLTKRIIVPHKN